MLENQCYYSCPKPRFQIRYCCNGYGLIIGYDTSYSSCSTCCSLCSRNPSGSLCSCNPCGRLYSCKLCGSPSIRNPSGSLCSCSLCSSLDSCNPRGSPCSRNPCGCHAVTTPVVVPAVATPVAAPAFEIPEVAASFVTGLATPSEFLKGPPTACGDASSPFNKYLVLPRTDQKKSKTHRTIMPKSKLISGDRYME
ncbi:hypothetical protein DPMN_045229 [Dreissena polymorpha]|uniref:Uncharacterized protein n=1 Tax=Dreissena polymorpha TaxID=45954 RepID=A0A9D4D643_DREPO|nr:hypothetical protein DPMN_045229 [Dreissena polymorpha]